MQCMQKLKFVNCQVVLHYVISWMSIQLYWISLILNQNGRGLDIRYYSQNIVIL